jgi:uncharacterized protein DUF222
VLRIAPSTATVRVALARRLAGPLLATRQALLAGQITARHAAVLAEAVRPVDDATGTAVQDRVLSKGADDTVAEFARRVRRAVLILDPAGQEQRHCAAVDQRRVVITPDDDGMAQLWALLPAVGAATVGAALNALAAESRKGRDGEARTADQRRADALVTMADAVLADPKRERHQGQAPAIQVTVAASTLIGQDDQPGELAGYGPISATTARRLATDENAKWRTLLTDDAGQLIEVGRRSYRPRQVLRDFIVARDRSCTFPVAHNPPCGAISTMSGRTAGAGPPTRLICRPYADAITGPSTGRNGPLAVVATAPPPGPVRRATPTAPNHRRCRSIDWTTAIVHLAVALGLAQRPTDAGRLVRRPGNLAPSYSDGHAFARRTRASPSNSGRTRVSATMGMKLVSPPQRGTTC